MPDSSQEPHQSEPGTIDHVHPAGISGEGQDLAEAVTQAPAEGPTGEWAIPARVQIPGYEMLGLLGKGGMGVVYKARQVALDRTVALKMILHAEHAGPAERQRFQVEAEAAARLQHPNIVQVFEVGTHEGLPYLTLEYCPGGSLAQRLDGTPWPIREAVQLVETLAGAVQAAHAAKIVHRDLNPANVLLTAAGQPKITDFGLAKKLGEASRTQSGAVVGTPSYMSPEQAGGKAKEVGPATDIYALGAILYELLAGRPPFKAATPLDTILQVAADEPSPLRRLRPNVPRDLETICHKCLEKAPAARYASAESLAADLRHFLAGEPIRIRRISAWGRALKWVRRRPAVFFAALASMVALSSLTLALAVFWLYTGARNASIAAPRVADAINPSVPDVPKVVPPAEVVANPPVPVDQKEKNKEAANDKLSAAARERVRRATVYIRVKTADGDQLSGSGFFGCREAPNIVLTNAHVIGMLAPESITPQDVEVVVNRGEDNEWSTKARVLGVDRISDLAVLETGAAPKTVLQPLTASQLRHLDELYVFGFPLGKALGEEITIRPASVSSFRRDKKTGILRQIQVNVGMDPGNSGGPVVDPSGSVVGMAVAGIEGTQINFVIPGERVQAIVDGYPSGLTVQQPYFTVDSKVAVPVILNTIDPRNLIKEIGLEIWTGNPPPIPNTPTRPAAATRPPDHPGDSPHVYFKMRYLDSIGKAQIVLPELPKGKVYWQQAKWTNTKGETHWAPASLMQLPSAPIWRKDANLVLHYTQGAKRTMELAIDNAFKVSGADEVDALHIRTATTFTETVSKAGKGGTLLSLRYKSPPSCDLVLPDGKSIPKPPLESIKKELPGAITSLLQLDPLGNIIHQSVDSDRLKQQTQSNPKQIESMNEFHKMIQLALEAVSVSMPPGGSPKPLETWKAERRVPIDTPGKALEGKLDVTFTYQGTRKRDGREEAVITLEGRLRSRDNSSGGKVDGQIVVDLANGQTLLAEMTAKLQLKALLQVSGEKPRELRLLDTMKIRMQRK